MHRHRQNSYLVKWQVLLGSAVKSQANFRLRKKTISAKTNIFTRVLNFVNSFKLELPSLNFAQANLASVAA